jgi:hypothetical protein
VSFWRATKLLVVTVFCLVPLVWCGVQAFGGLLLGRCAMFSRHYYLVEGKTAKICGVLWLVLFLVMAFILVFQFRKGFNEGESGS